MAECGDSVLYVIPGPNGTVQFYTEEVECADTHYVVAAFLALVSILAIVLNVLLIVTVAASYTLKKKPLNLFLLSLACAGALEAVFSVPLAAAFAARERWPTSEHVCRADAAISEATLFITSFTMFLLCLDRALMMKYLHNYRKHMTSAKRNAAILLSWGIGLLMVSPMVFGLLDVVSHEGRYGCNGADGVAAIAYSVIVLTFGYVAPLVGMIVCTMQVGRTIKGERKQLKKLQLKRSFAYTEQVFVTPYLKTEQGPTLMVLALLVLYVLLCLPQAVIVHLDQAISQYNVTAMKAEQTEAAEARMGNASTVLVNNNSTLAELSASNETRPSVKIEMPMVAISSLHEPVFMWFRFIFLLASPLVAILLHKDFRKKMEGLLLCCRPNSVDDYASVRPISAYVQKKSASAKKSGKSRSQSQVTSYKTPVLFSTAGGIHLRVLNLGAQRTNSMRFLGLDLSLKGSFAPDPEFEIMMCDLSLPAEELPDSDIIQESVPEHADFQDTIELPRQQSPHSAGTDSGVEVESSAQKPKQRAKKVVRFAQRTTEVATRGGRPASESDEAALLSPDSPGAEPPHALKPTHSRAATPSPNSRKLRQRAKLKQKPPQELQRKPAPQPALESTFTVPQGKQRRRTQPAAGRAAPRAPQNRYAPAGGRPQRTAPPREPARRPSDMELETFTAEDSFGVLR